jgi:acyl-CoA thioesterase-2
MTTETDTLLETLDLEPLEVNLVRGRSPQVGWQRVFGGQVVAQALVAATRTVGHLPAHSLHGYFLIGGDPAVPIIFEVDRIRDGRSYVTRRVVAIQHGRAIFTMAASFHAPEADSLDHQFAMPEVPQPEALPSHAQMQETFRDDAPDTVRRYLDRQRALELRPVDFRHYITRDALPPVQNVWLRAMGKLPDDPAIHAAILAYASDMTLLDTALFAHGTSVFDREMQLASLDHAIWFHRPARVDEWLLYAQDSPSTFGGRGFNRGSIYSQSGLLVASTSQEGVTRRKKAAETL